MLIVFNTYCFSTATVVTRTRLNITLYIHWLSYSVSFYSSPDFGQCHKISHKEVKYALFTARKLKYRLIWSLWVQSPWGKKTLSSKFSETTETEMYKNKLPIYFLNFWRFWESFLLPWVHTLLECTTISFRKIYENKNGKGSRQFWIRHGDNLSYTPHRAPSNFESKDGGTRNNTGLWWRVVTAMRLLT